MQNDVSIGRIRSVDLMFESMPSPGTRIEDNEKIEKHAVVSGHRKFLSVEESSWSERKIQTGEKSNQSAHFG